MQGFWKKALAWFWNNIRPVEQLYQQSFEVTEFAAATTEFVAAPGFKVQAGRGNVQAWGLTVIGEAGITDEEFLKALVTVAVSGVTAIEERSLFAFSTNYRFERRTIIPQFISESAPVVLSVKNPGTKKIFVSLDLYWYDPLQNFNIPFGPEEPIVKRDDR